MLQIPKITYEDKVDYQIEGEDEKYKISAKDMNEIKKTFNDSAGAIEDAINTLDTTINEVNETKKQTQTSEANAKNYMNEANKSKEAILNNLGLIIQDNFLCMEEGE